MYHANVNENAIAINLTQIKIGIIINVGASVKSEKKHRVCEKDYI